jgi:hypothetical protein
MTNEVQTFGPESVTASPSTQTPQPLQPPQTASVLDSAMNTGIGADDEPEMLVGDKHQGDTLPDLDGDGKLSVAEAEELLGANDTKP